MIINNKLVGKFPSTPNQIALKRNAWFRRSSRIALPAIYEYVTQQVVEFLFTGRILGDLVTWHLVLSSSKTMCFLSHNENRAFIFFHFKVLCIESKEIPQNKWKLFLLEGLLNLNTINFLVHSDKQLKGPVLVKLSIYGFLLRNEKPSAFLSTLRSEQKMPLEHPRGTQKILEHINLDWFIIVRLGPWLIFFYTMTNCALSFHFKLDSKCSVKAAITDPSVN